MSYPHEDPAADSARRIGQLIVLAVQLAELAVQLAELRAQARFERDAHAASLAAARLQAAYACAQTAWSPIDDPRWLADADTLDVAQAWGAATPWAQHGDTDALHAMRAAERRLHELHPDAMATYDRLRASGMTPDTAMRQAAPQMQRRSPPPDGEWRPGNRQPYPGSPGPPRADGALAGSSRGSGWG